MTFIGLLRMLAIECEKKIGITITETCSDVSDFRFVSFLSTLLHTYSELQRATFALVRTDCYTVRGNSELIDKFTNLKNDEEENRTCKFFN